MRGGLWALTPHPCWALGMACQAGSPKEASSWAGRREDQGSVSPGRFAPPRPPASEVRV